MSLISLCAFAKETPAVWGKIIVKEQKIKNLTYKYFVYFENKGVAEAYPLETSDKKMAEQILKNANQRVRVEGEIKKTEIAIDGPKQIILVFIPHKISPMSLSDLSINDDKGIAPALAGSPMAKAKGPYNGGGISIPDKVANTIIFTGAALMLGSALKNTFKKD